MYSVGLFPPFLQPIAVVHQIELAVDDGPSLGIDRVLVRRRLVRRAHRAIAVVLRRVALRILGEQIAMLAAGKAPAQFVPQIFKFGLALNGFAVGEISHRIVAADRKLRFVAPGSRSEQRHEQQAEQRRALPQSKKRNAPHGLPPGHDSASQTSVASRCSIEYSAHLSAARSNLFAIPADLDAAPQGPEEAPCLGSGNSPPFCMRMWSVSAA